MNQKKDGALSSQSSPLVLWQANTCPLMPQASVKRPSQWGPFLIQPTAEEVHTDLDSSEGKIISNPRCWVDNGATQGNRTPEKKKTDSGGA